MGIDPLRCRLLSGIVNSMNAAELIFQKTSALPPELQQEALRYVDYLVERQSEAEAARDWAKFSANQLARAYAPEDAIYDQD